MCLNCGCGEYWDKRGNAANITMDDVDNATKGEGMKVEDATREMINGLGAALKQLRSRKK